MATPTPTPTAADRELAESAVLDTDTRYTLASDDYEAVIESVAQALARVRAETRQQYLNLADELNEMYNRDGWQWDEAAKVALHAADRIRAI